MNLLTKTGLITATSLGLIACGGANNGSNTPSTSKAKAPATQSPSAKTSSESLRAAMTLPFVMATAAGKMAYQFDTEAKKAGNVFDLKYKSAIGFNNYVNNDIKVDGNAYLQTEFSLDVGPNNDGTKVMNGTLTYGFDLTADDLNDLSGAVSAKDKRTCNFKGEKATDYTLKCSLGDTVKTPSEEYTFKLNDLGGYWRKGNGFHFNGTFKGIDGGDVVVDGADLYVCDSGLLGSGTITIDRPQANDSTTIKFNDCATPGFTATYASSALPKVFTMKALPTK